MENSPLVSICIPAYNAAAYIETTLSCLINQTYKNIELIIVDDHSTDETLIKVLDIKDKRIKILGNRKKGAASARNLAYQNAIGEYFIFFDADDLIEHDFIETQFNTLGSALSNVVVSSWGRFTGNSVSTFQTDSFILKRDMSFYEWIIEYWTFYRHTTPPGRVLIPKKIIEKAGLWNESLSLNDDFEFFTRIFLNSSLIKYNDNGTFYYRSGIGGLSSDVSSTAYESYFKTLELSLQRVQERFPDDKKIALACANLWQMFIYHIYPNKKAFLKKAETEVKRLGGADIGFPAGGKTEILLKAVGWKLTKRIKSVI
jgi:glycosyltransferase involved in cell wall biosynthesis